MLLTTNYIKKLQFSEMLPVRGSTVSFVCVIWLCVCVCVCVGCVCVCTHTTKFGSS
jgi:hypothetical protein